MIVVVLMTMAVAPRRIAAVDRVQKCDGGEHEDYSPVAVAVVPAAVVVADAAVVAAGIVGVGHAVDEDGDMIVAGDIGKDKVANAHLDDVLHDCPSEEGSLHCLHLDGNE